MAARLPVALALAAALAGCGERSERPPPAPAAPAQLACRTLREADVRAALRAVGVRAPAQLELETKRETPELSDCRYFAGDRAGVWLTIDRAVQAQKRFWYRMTEAVEFESDGRGPAIVPVPRVGQDKPAARARAVALRARAAPVIGRRAQRIAPAATSPRTTTPRPTR